MVINKSLDHSVEEILEKRKSDIYQITMQVRSLEDINYINNLLAEKCSAYDDFNFGDLPLLIIYSYAVSEYDTTKVKPGYYVILCINTDCDIITIDQMYSACMDIIEDNYCIISASEWSTYLTKYENQLSYRYKKPIVNIKEINKDDLLNKLDGLYQKFIKDYRLGSLLNNNYLIKDSKNSKLKLFMLITFYTAYRENITKNIFFVVDNKKNYKLAKDTIMTIVDTWVINLDKSDVIIFSGSTRSDTKLFSKLINHISNDLSLIDESDAINRIKCYTEGKVEDTCSREHNTLVINHKLNKRMDYNYGRFNSITNDYEYMMEYKKYISFINVMDISKDHNKSNDIDIKILRESLEYSKKSSNMIFADELFTRNNYDYTKIVAELERLYEKYKNNKNIFIYLK